MSREKKKNKRIDRAPKIIIIIIIVITIIKKETTGATALGHRVAQATTYYAKHDTGAGPRLEPLVKAYTRRFPRARSRGTLHRTELETVGERTAREERRGKEREREPDEAAVRSGTGEEVREGKGGTLRYIAWRAAEGRREGRRGGGHRRPAPVVKRNGAKRTRRTSAGWLGGRDREARERKTTDLSNVLS